MTSQESWTLKKLFQKHFQSSVLWDYIVLSLENIMLLSKTWLNLSVHIFLCEEIHNSIQKSLFKFR